MNEIVDEKNNKIIGNVNLDNSKVKFIGSNNVLYINDEITLVNSSIEFRGDNSLVYLCKTSEKITVDIKVPTEKVALNSITQEYETTAYTPALYDTAVVYITRNAVETKFPTLKGSAMALAMFDGAKWQLLKAEDVNGKPIKETEMTAGTAYASKVAATPATATEFSKTLYNIFNWNFEQTQFEKI